MFRNTISLFEEMVSYETLFGMRDASQKTVAALFEQYDMLPSGVLDKLMREHLLLHELRDTVREYVAALSGFTVSVHRAYQYPEKLRVSKYPPELFYYRGEIGLTESKCVSIVGARKCSEAGKKRASRLAREVVADGWTVVSGLAEGIDTAAMTSAVAEGGRTIGVIGTPINQSYPKSNAELQETVASEHLLVSHVPFFRYENQPFRTRRYYFPERNATMAAISDATVIVEASEGSGTLTQARACIQQGRTLFILNSCFENPAITWPHEYERQGAIRIRSTDEILEVLAR